jgi:hypothetical protein
MRLVDGTRPEVMEQSHESRNNPVHRNEDGLKS